MELSAADEGDSRESGSLARFFALVEKHGNVVLLSRSLEEVASLDARIALHAGGVLAATEPVASWPCDVRGCSREIRANYGGARKPIVAVCCQAPPVCEPLELGFEDVSQQRISIEALVRAICALLGAEVNATAIAGVNARHPIGGNREPVLVGATRSPVVRDVFWAGTPRDTDLGAFCTRREHVKRRTLVLVPTERYVPLEVAARFARGERVEVLSLADSLEVREGAIALVKGDGAPTPLFSTRPPPGIAERDGLATLLGAARWEDIRILAVDEHTVRIEAGTEAVLRTFVELGFTDTRKKEGAKPVTGWHVLLLLCHKGVLRPSEYRQFGKQWGAKKGIEDMRRRLRLAFGLEGDPLLSYLTRTGWRPRFRVNPTV
jgi:hypothetical protein